MSKVSSAKYYQNNKERLQKSLAKISKSFREKERKTRDNMGVNDKNIFLKMKNKN